MNKKLFQFTITITDPSDPYKTIYSDTVEANSLVELTSKIPLSIIRGKEILDEYSKRAQQDDDIPF